MDFWRVLHILLVISHWGTESPGFHDSHDLLVTQKDLTHIALQVFKCLFAVFLVPFVCTAFQLQSPARHTPHSSLVRFHQPTQVGKAWLDDGNHHHDLCWSAYLTPHPKPIAPSLPCSWATQHTHTSLSGALIFHTFNAPVFLGLKCQSRSVGIMISPSWPDIPVASCQSICVLPCKSLVVIAGAFSSCSNTWLVVVLILN